MKVYIVEYESPVNLFKGFKIVEAETLTGAQTKFLEWLIKQDVWQHLWQISFKIVGDNHKPFEVI